MANLHESVGAANSDYYIADDLLYYNQPSRCADPPTITIVSDTQILVGETPRVLNERDCATFSVFASHRAEDVPPRLMHKEPVFAAIEVERIAVEAVRSSIKRVRDVLRTGDDDTISRPSAGRYTRYRMDPEVLIIDLREPQDRTKINPTDPTTLGVEVELSYKPDVALKTNKIYRELGRIAHSLLPDAAVKGVMKNYPQWESTVEISGTSQRRILERRLEEGVVLPDTAALESKRRSVVLNGATVRIAVRDIYGEDLRTLIELEKPYILHKLRE